MAAVIHAAQTRQMKTVASAFSGLESASLPVAVRAIVRAAMQHHHDDMLLATAIDHEEARLDMDAQIAPYLHEGGVMAAAVLANYRDQIAPLDPERAARTLPVLVRAVVDAWANLSPPDLETAEDEAVRAVVGYLHCTMPVDV